MGGDDMDEKDFSLRLAQLREKKGVSARDMSLSMGQNPGYVNNIETGKSMPSLTGIFYICDYLGITPSEFFDTGVSNPNKIDAIVQDLRMLDETALDTIAAVVKNFRR
jgi:transcriptional regulator with XRE-family HTH domain